MIGRGDSLEAQFSMENERGGVVEERPFHMLVLGDWTADADKKPLREKSILEVDRDNFNDVLARLAPVLKLDINGRELSLEFSSLDDFHPDRLFQRVPMFSELRDLRRRLKDKDTFNEAAREMRSQSTSEAPAAADPDEAIRPEEGPDDLLGRILSRPSGGAPVKSSASTEISSLVNELVRPHLVTIDEDEQQSMLASVDNATGNLMRRILHDHKFRELEAAWRGLFLLVRRAETGSDLKVFILDATHDELSDDLKSNSDLGRTYIYDLVAGDGPREPWAAIVGNFGFRPVVDDVAWLIRMSKICAAANAPFISHMRPEILGIHSLAGNTDPRSWNMSPVSPEAKLWSMLRSLPESAYLGLTIPRFLGRLPYGAETDPLETFAFEEFEGVPVHDDFVWLNSAFACAALLAQSFSENGWEIGSRLIQDLDRLPVYTYVENGETVYLPCAEVQLSQTAADVLGDYGLMPLVSFKNADHVRLTRFQSAADPPTVLRGKWTIGQR